MAERTVRFYEIVTRQKEPFPNVIQFGELQAAVQELPDHEAYVHLPRMEILGSAWFPGSGVGAVPKAPLIALDRITREPYIRIERRRNYRPLVLDTDETLAEPSFYSIFDRNVLGVMRNSGDSPSSASFRDYINLLGFIKPDIEIIPLVDANAIRALHEVQTLTKLHISVGPDVDAVHFSRSRFIYDAIRNARRNLGSVGVEILVRIAPRGQGAASEEALRQIEQVATTDALEHADKAKINYRRIEDGKADAYDFVHEAVTKSAVVELDTSTGQPTEVSVAEAMAAAYDELYDDIRSALRAMH